MLIAVWRNKHTKGHLPQSCFGCEKVSSFLLTKTSANKRLLNYVCKLLVCGAKVVNYFELNK